MIDRINDSLPASGLRGDSNHDESELRVIHNRDCVFVEDIEDGEVVVGHVHCEGGLILNCLRGGVQCDHRNRIRRVLDVEVIAACVSEESKIAQRKAQILAEFDDSDVILDS